jgi:hypothetical protein
MLTLSAHRLMDPLLIYAKSLNVHAVSGFCATTVLWRGELLAWRGASKPACEQRIARGDIILSCAKQSCSCTWGQDPPEAGRINPAALANWVPLANTWPHLTFC